MTKKEINNFLLPLDLLRVYNEKPVGVDFEDSKNIIENEFKLIEVGVFYNSYNLTPRVAVFKYTIFENYENYKPKEFADNLCLSLNSYPVRVSFSAGLEKCIIIEIPNKKKAMVGLRNALEGNEFDRLAEKIVLPIGRDDSMSNNVVDIRERGSIIIAGATNSGKSNFFHTIIASLLFQARPEEMNLILMDLKRVELVRYKDLPHLKFPVTIDATGAKKSLDWCLEEIDKRLEVLRESGINNIVDYNSLNKDKWPFNVVMIDEFSDLMVSNYNNFLNQISRIANMGNAVGFTTILGTSRPDPKKVMPKELIDEFPIRISFSTASEQDSITILGESGGEKLLGCGDMLYKQSEVDIKLSGRKITVADNKIKNEKNNNTLSRLQGFFISDDEIEKIIEAVKTVLE